MSEPYLTRLQARMERGDSLEEAADRYGLALWRAKATFVRAGLPIPAPVQRRAPLSEEVRALGAKIHAYLVREDNASSTEIAAALGVTRAEVVAATWPLDAPRVRRALSSHERYPDEAILVGLQAMSLTLGRERGARGGVPLTTKHWDAHRDREVQPASTLISLRFGGWVAACQAAGVPTRAAAKVDTHKRWTDDQCLEAVRRFFSGGHGWTSAHYGRWSTGNNAPSALTVIAKLGPWPALRERVLG